MTKQSCIIVGGGHAAAKLAGSLREQGWSGFITIITDEPFLPYHRPPLSKDFLLGQKKVEDLYINDPDFYRENDVEVLLNTRVSDIDPKAHTVTLEQGGDVLSYTKLVLATGAHVRRLPVPGAGQEGVAYVRTAEDAQRIMTLAAGAKNAVVIGGGYIGLETAAVLNAMGIKVTVLEAFDRVLRRVATSEVSSFFERIHEEEGVQFAKNVIVNRIEGNGSVTGVVCDNGTVYPADLVVIGIGVIPSTKLAENAGLKVDTGIMVDKFCQTSDPDIFAAGDCTEHFNEFYQHNVRLESVQNALGQAECAAATLSGNPRIYQELPWFWSTQYDVKLQITGLNTGYDQVIIRGDLEQGRRGSVFYLKDGRVISVYALNTPPDFAFGKRLIESRTIVDPQQLADEQVPLRNLLVA